MGYKRATKIMKKILTCLLFFGISSSMLSQEKQMYCELVGTSTSLFKENVAVHIDFGFMGQNAGCDRSASPIL